MESSCCLPLAATPFSFSQIAAEICNYCLISGLFGVYLILAEGKNKSSIN
jgi:hypothetical protein